MSLVKLTEDKFERFTLVTNPPRTFSSSSLGVTGSVNLFARENRILKESETYFSSSLLFDETKSVETARLAVKKRYSLSTNINGYVNSYMTKVNNESLSARRDTSTLISRFTPGLTIDKDHLKKYMDIKKLELVAYKYKNDKNNSRIYPKGIILNKHNIDNQAVKYHFNFISKGDQYYTLGKVISILKSLQSTIDFKKSLEPEKKFRKKLRQNKTCYKKVLKTPGFIDENSFKIDKKLSHNKGGNSPYKGENKKMLLERKKDKGNPKEIALSLKQKWAKYRSGNFK